MVARGLVTGDLGLILEGAEGNLAQVFLNEMATVLKMCP